MKITKINETEEGPTAIDTPKTPIDRTKDILKTGSRFVGMSGSRDAERIFDLARKTLAKNPIAPFEFNAALGGLMAVGELVGIRPALVERAYENIPQNKRIFVRSSIAEFYYCMGNFEKAASLLPSDPSTESELCLAMRVFVALKKFDEAGEIARRCRQAVIKAGRLLQPPQPPDENPRIFLARSCVELRQALEHYYLAMGLWHDAATIWKFMPSDPLSDETEP